MLRSFSTLSILIWAIFSLAQTGTITYDHDDRSTPSAIFNPDFRPVSYKEDLNPARTYLKQNWATFGLAKQATNLVYKTVRPSLLGNHFTFVQQLNGIEIESAKIIVSVDHQGSVYRVANNTFPNAKAVQPVMKNLLDSEMALEMGWQHLSVVGKLLDLPKTELCYLHHDGNFSLVYRVKMEVNDPLGDWRIAIDATTGEVLHTQNRHIYHKNGQGELAPQSPPAYDGRISDFGEELARFKQLKRERSELLEKTSSKRADGRGMIFDPDPRTTLLDDTLQNNSPDAAFTNAFVEQPLRDITLDNGTYSLTGPWVQMVNLDSPATPPTTTTDGFWNFTRGNFGLNEATTYFHIDQSQREIQAMGFTGNKGLQEAPIRVDVNALDGADNSLFSTPNELWFGAGCVDDSEDADVILHEYGHAIQYSINNDFFGQAHEGAMGEGFGDYWASSYSISRPNGFEFFPSRMFTWDGQFDCWNGRATNKFDLVYQHNTTNYDAHAPIPGGISDELWSTPLFQTLLELYSQGIPREQVDQIIIEAQFGLGINQKMRLVAESIVQTSSMLHPDGPHAQVFREYFANHGILDPATTFSYVSAHVPPDRASNDWKSEILITNPNSVTANLGITVYESNDQGVFGAQPAQDLAIAPGETATFVPGGTNQRWVQFTSDQPLAGTNFFMRRPSDAVGTEKAGIPLLSDTETSQALILPHVPADRASFWSGAVVLNPGNTTVNLTIELVGTNGNLLPGLLSPSAKTQLAPREKWVTFISEGPGGIAGIFDDSGSAEKVSYVRITSDSGELGAFELFGYNSNTGAVATSGIVALPDQNRTLYPIRTAVTDADFSSFSILNPLDNAADATVNIYGQDDSLVMSKTFSFPAKTKQLGLNLKGGNFTFPIGNPDAINLAGDGLAWMTIETNAPLRVFELSGDTARTTLDGAAVVGATTRTVFQKPNGKLQILQGKHPGTVTVRTTITGGTPSEQSFNMKAGENMSMDIAANTESIDVSGALFSANVIDRDFTSGALTIVKGTQVQLSQNQGKFQVNIVDDHGNDFAQATSISVNETTAGELEYSNDRDFFKLEITQAGTLNVFSTGSTDTQGTLFSATMMEIEFVDDIGGGNLNFGITQPVTPATYFVAVNGYQDRTGRYTLNVEFTPNQANAKAIALQPIQDPQSGLEKTIQTKARQ